MKEQISARAAEQPILATSACALLPTRPPQLDGKLCCLPEAPIVWLLILRTVFRVRLAKTTRIHREFIALIIGNSSR
jgi:hypothetical protein